MKERPLIFFFITEDRLYWLLPPITFTVIWSKQPLISQRSFAAFLFSFFFDPVPVNSTCPQLTTKLYLSVIKQCRKCKMQHFFLDKIILLLLWISKVVSVFTYCFSLWHGRSTNMSMSMKSMEVVVNCQRFRLIHSFLMRIPVTVDLPPCRISRALRYLKAFSMTTGPDHRGL